MAGAKTRHTRRHRRQAKAVLKFGPSAKPKHALKSGRTGQVHKKKIASRKVTTK